MTSITITYSIPQADRDSTSSFLHQMIEVSTDSGTTWKVYMDGGNWIGGTGAVGKNSTVVNPPPSMTLAGPALSALAGHLTRGHWVIPVAITIGATVTAV